MILHNYSSLGQVVFEPYFFQIINNKNLESIVSIQINIATYSSGDGIPFGLFRDGAPHSYAIATIPP